MFRVLHIGSGNLFGGVETLLVTLARYRALCPAMEPHFALCFEGRLSEELSATKAPVYQLGKVRVREPWSVIRARRKLKEILQNTPFDAVICHSAWPQALFGPVALATNRRLIFWLHNVAGGKHWVERWAKRVLPDFVLCNSQFTAETLPTLYPNTPYAVSYYPVAVSVSIISPAERQLVRQELDTAPDAIVIIQTSRLEWWKGQTLHLDALEKLKDVPNWVCWQAGGVQRPEEESYFQQLRDKAQQLGIADRVRFLGQRSDVARLLAAADIHCQPNAGPEPFGIVFIEGMLAQLPIVTTAIGGGRELVTESCGILVPPQNPIVLSEALRRLIQNADLRNQMGSNGPPRAQELCEPGRAINRLYQLVSSTIKRRQAT